MTFHMKANCLRTDGTGEVMHSSEATNLYYCLTDVGCLHNERKGSKPQNFYVRHFYFHSLTRQKMQIFKVNEYWDYIVANRQKGHFSINTK